MTKRVRPGAVLELSTDDGFIYIHYVGTHSEYGDAITVRPTSYADRVAPSSDLFREGYFIFYPARAAVTQGLAEVVGQLPSPGLPNRLRRPGVRSGTKIETWIIEDASGERVKSKLSEEERRLPIAVLWNHELLVQRVREGWRPEMEGRDDE